MRPSIPILILLSALWIIGGTWFLSSSFCGAAGAAGGGGIPNFSVKDGNFSTKPVETFSFNYSSDRVVFSDKTIESMKTIASHLKKNPERLLTLSGVFARSEKNETAFDNLGIARAKSIKSKLVKYGAPNESIATEGFLVDNTQFNKNRDDKTVLYGGVNFIFTGQEGSDIEVEGGSESSGSLGLSSSTTSSALAPYVINYTSSNIKMAMTTEISDLLASLRAYLDDHPGSKVIVTGHTDSNGSNSDALNAASKVRRFLRNNDFASKEVVAESKGSSDPIASNETEEGRKMNKRVTISIEK